MANPYCGTTSSVFSIALWGDGKSTFPKGEGIGGFRTSAEIDKKTATLSGGG